MIEAHANTPAHATRLLVEHGAVMFDELFDPALVTTIGAALHHHFENAIASGRAEYNEVGDRRYMIPVPLRAPFTDERLCDQPTLRAVLTAMLGADYVIQSYGAVIAMAGAALQHFHRDLAMLYSPEIGATLPAYALTLGVPLFRLTEAHGTTALCLGTHRQPAGNSATGEMYLPYPELGGAFLWDYRLVHAGMPNRSKQHRPMLYVVFARPWFVDPDNFSTVDPLVRDTNHSALSERMAILLRCSK